MTENLIRYIVVIAVVLVLLAIKACTGRPAGMRPVMIPAPSLQGSRFANPAEQPALVILPPSYYTTDRRYPVVYYLPGFTTYIEEIVTAKYRRGRLDRAIHRLMKRGDIQEMIFVVANGRNFLGGSFYTNSPVTGNWEDYIVRDVVGYIDANFRTLARAGSRGITGESMGGFGSFHLAMKHPDVFGCVYSFSPGLFDERGINNLDFYLSPDVARRYLDIQAELDRLGAGEADRRFQTIIRELYDSGDDDNYRLASLFAYCAAFSPRPDGGVPYIDFPFTDTDGRMAADQAVLKKLENGYGGMAGKVSRYAGNLAALKAIVIDYGRSDHYEWIPRGCVYLSGLLEQAGIDHQLRAHDGGHGDKLRERMETHMLPFFSVRLKR